MIAVVEYLNEAGASPFRKWFAALDPEAAVKVRRAIARMELGNFGDFKSVSRGVYECRIHFGPGYHVYYARDGERLVILLGGGAKKRQQRDIEGALANWSDYKMRRKEH